MFETWILFALISSLFSGIGNFLNKVAAHKHYNGELFVLYGTAVPLFFTIPYLVVSHRLSEAPFYVLCIGFFAGVFTSISVLGKISALKYIDITIFLPLYKVTSPALVIFFGILFFQESFTSYEWLGLMIGLMIPLLLISRTEKHRQNNLALGLAILVITSITTAIVAVLDKYAITIFDDVLVITMAGSAGILCVCSVLFIIKNKKAVLNSIYQDTSWKMLSQSIARGVAMTLSFLCFLYALKLGGSLGIVYTINSLYILIPIILSIIFYGEHWNARKVIAIILSVVALAFFG